MSNHEWRNSGGRRVLTLMLGVEGTDGRIVEVHYDEPTGRELDDLPTKKIEEELSRLTRKVMEVYSAELRKLLL